jgi:hypothetical protein
VRDVQHANGLRERLTKKGEDMKSTRVLVLGLVLSSFVIGSTGQTLSGDAPDPGNTSQEWRGQPARDNQTIQLFRLMGRDTLWTHVETITMNWQTFHTQGLVKIGETFYVSAVEVTESTVRTGTVTDALYDFSLDRSPGAGRGWLFKFDAAGQLLGQLELTDGAKYHPGGIDYDSQYIWVPVAEYRPNSESNIYRIDPETLTSELVFAVNDHIGGIVHNLHRGTLHGVSWGSRRFYTWTVAGEVVSDWVPNAQFYIDYQDCHYQEIEYMLCGGVASYSIPSGSSTFNSIAFGGLDLVDLRRARPEHQVPVNRFIDEGSGANPSLALTHNAFWVEPGANRSLRAYFMTESNNQADLLVYDATPWVNR